MRKRFEVQYELGATPIEDLEIPTKSRDQLPPVLRALQYIYTTPKLNKQVLEILAAKVLRGKKKTGRNGMTLWEILVLATIRLSRDADYDQLHYMSTTDNLIRGLLGVCKYGPTSRVYSLQCIKDNVGLIDDETLEQVDALVVKAGHQLVQKKDEKLNVKLDSYVLESGVHFPTDYNILCDAACKSIHFASELASSAGFDGWRKSAYWKNQFKSCCRKIGRISKSSGKKKQAKLRTAANEYLELAGQLSKKFDAAEADFKRLAESCEESNILFELLKYFKEHLDNHIDLVSRRILNGETIPHSEKVFSLFEPYTEWIQKGKAGNRPELGLNIAIATDPFNFILLHRVMVKQHDKDLAVPMTEALLSKYDVGSMSFDKNFWTKENHQKLSKLVPNLILPKKGKCNQQEYEREHSKTFLALRRQHSAVESAINCLEHHGLNRCPDKGLDHFKKYTALGVLAYNLHKLGNILLEKERRKSKNSPLRKAA